MKTVIVLSGGMDSTTALAWAKQNSNVVGSVHFQYGSKHNSNELTAAKAVAAHYGLELTVVDMPFINRLFKSDLLQNGGEIPEGHYADPSMKRTVVPFRNGIMLSIAAGYAESIDSEAVVLGNHFGDHAIYPDCRVDFINAMNSAIKLGTYKEVCIMAPFEKKTKADIAKIGAALGVPYHLTWSCYKGGEKHCGKCGTCYERKEAFVDAGVIDPTEYL